MQEHNFRKSRSQFKIVEHFSFELFQGSSERIMNKWIRINHNMQNIKTKSADNSLFYQTSQA